MTIIGHNMAPLDERLFADSTVSITDLLAVIAAKIERDRKADIERLSTIASQLASNRSRLPETFSDADVLTALDLLARLDQHADEAKETTDAVLSAALVFVDELQTLCKPLDAGIAPLEKSVRERLVSALTRQLDAHNAERSEGEKPMVSLTLRGPSGAKATATDGDEIEIVSASEIPREFLIPDTKAIAAAIKSGKEVPGVGKRRKVSLRVSAK